MPPALQTLYIQIYVYFTSHVMEVFWDHPIGALELPNFELFQKYPFLYGENYGHFLLKYYKSFFLVTILNLLLSVLWNGIYV